MNSDGIADEVKGRVNSTGEVAGVEDAYVHFNNIGGAPLDVMVGQFQACEVIAGERVTARCPLNGDVHDVNIYVASELSAFHEYVGTLRVHNR